MRSASAPNELASSTTAISGFLYVADQPLFITATGCCGRAEWNETIFDLQCKLFSTGRLKACALQPVACFPPGSLARVRANASEFVAMAGLSAFDSVGNSIELCSPCSFTS